MKNSLVHAIMKAVEYYDTKTFHHVLRVMKYVEENGMIPYEQKANSIILAVLHDIIEDTECTIEELELSSYLEGCLLRLSKADNESYVEYLQEIKDSSKFEPEAYWVKLADMKDHLAQKETLTDKLKKKYLDGLSYLL